MFRWPNLVDVLAGTPWAIVGGVATRLYMPERATQHLDILILAKDAEEVANKLRAAGYSKEGALGIPGSAWRAPGGTPVDVIEGSESWWPDALAEAEDNRDPHGAPVPRAPYLVLMKLLAFRTQDMADIARIMAEATDAQIALIRSVVRRYAADYLDDFESLVIQGRLEFPR